MCQKNENSNLHVLLKNIQSSVEYYQASMQQLQQEQVLAVEKQRNRFEHEISLLRKQLSEAINIEHRVRFENEKLQEQLIPLEPLKVHSRLLEKSVSQANDTILTLRHEQLFMIQEKANFEGQFKQLHIHMTQEKSEKILT